MEPLVRDDGYDPVERELVVAWKDKKEWSG